MTPPEVSQVLGGQFLAKRTAAVFYSALENISGGTGGGENYTLMLRLKTD